MQMIELLQQEEQELLDKISKIDNALQKKKIPQDVKDKLFFIRNECKSKIIGNNVKQDNAIMNKE